MLEACTTRFLENKPWLRGGRKGGWQSDNATNYRDPTLLVDAIAVGSHCFNEPGMGKGESHQRRALPPSLAPPPTPPLPQSPSPSPSLRLLDEGDANGGVNKAWLCRKRDEGYDQEHADDYVLQLTMAAVPGNSTTKMMINRANEDGGVVGRSGTCRDHLLWSVMPGSSDDGGDGVGGVGGGGSCINGGDGSGDRHDKFLNGKCKRTCKVTEYTITTASTTIIAINATATTKSACGWLRLSSMRAQALALTAAPATAWSSGRHWTRSSRPRRLR